MLIDLAVAYSKSPAGTLIYCFDYLGRSVPSLHEADTSYPVGY